MASNYRESRSSESKSCQLLPILASKNTFLKQLISIDVGSNEFPNTLAEMLASQEGVDAAMSLQGNDALILVDVLDQVRRPMITRISRLIHYRLSIFRVWTSISGESVFKSSGKSVVCKPSCHIHVYSRTTSQRRAISLCALLMGSQTPGKATGMVAVCASKCSAATQPRNCRKSSRYAGGHLTCKCALVTSW